MSIKKNNIRLSLSDKHVLTTSWPNSNVMHLYYSHYHFIGIHSCTSYFKSVSEGILTIMTDPKQYKGTENQKILGGRLV